MRSLETNEVFKKELSRKKGMYQLTDEDIRQLQTIVYEITMDIVKLCDSHNIPYMLGGGSALGAIRHQGFIPWDDDIDINIERRYISQLLQLVRETYADKYLVLEPMVSKGYYSSFIQIQKKGTTFREYLWQKKEECGIKIDIFVIENTYNHVLARKFHGWGTDIGLFLLSCCRMHCAKEEFLALSEGNANAQKSIRIKSAIGTVVNWAPQWWYRRVQLWMQRCKDEQSKYVSVPSGRKHFFGELYQRERFCRVSKRPFENTELYVTDDYECYLTRLYGDYMTIPAEENQERHVLYELEY